MSVSTSSPSGRDCYLLRVAVLKELKRTQTWLIGLLQPLPGDLRSNYVTYVSRLVTWGHVRSFRVTLLPPLASYGHVGAQKYPKLKALYSKFQASTGQMTSLPGYWRPRSVT